MDPMQIVYILWFWVFPPLGILLMVFFPLFWKLIVPALARRLTWARFGSSDIIAMSDDAGWSEIIVSRRGIPEGILETREGKEKAYRFLPRPRWEEEEKPATDRAAQDIILRKSILKGLGKPFWYGYTGKIGLVNPSTAAILDTIGGNPSPVEKYLVRLDSLILTAPEDLKVGLTQVVNGLKMSLKAKSVDYVDPRKAIKENLPQMYTPSQIAALAANRERYGMVKKGREIGKLVLGGSIIIGLVIVAILLVMMLK